jgi:uncharacterized protein (TIGR03437 family)
MKRLLLCCLVACTTKGTGVNDGPELQMAMPGSASADTSVLLTGERLCGIAGDCTDASLMIEFLTAEQLQVPVSGATPTQISFVLPAFVPVGATNIVVYSDGDASNELPFTVTPR